MSKFDFLKEFYGKQWQLESFPVDVERILNNEKRTVKLIPFFYKDQIEDSFSFLSGGRFLVKLQRSSDGISLFKAKIVFHEREKDLAEDGYFFIIRNPSYPNIYSLITFESSKFFDNGLVPFIEKLYPSILTTFIGHKKLRGILEQFQTAVHPSKIEIKKASLKIRFAKEEGVAKTASSRIWSSLSLQEAFDYAYEQNGWFKSLEFLVSSQSKPSSEIYVSRKGFIRANGLFPQIHENMLIPIYTIINNNIRLFNNRSRRDDPQLDVRPLIIDFGQNQFSTLEENGKFIETMRKLKNSSISVLHGNPYIYLSLLDYDDGSSFDLWVLREDKLVIVPQLKGTISGIKKLINHIFDNYAEGRISDYSEESNAIA